MKAFAAVLFSFALASRAFGYGEEGHEAIGAIADALLATKSPAATQKVKTLLDGMTLQEAATIADRIKDWDKDKTYHLAGHVQIESDLRDFWSANNKEAPDNTEKLHHVFHYTDVSIAAEHPAYQDGAVGTSAYDIVHMMPYCIRVLTGEIPEENNRHISKPVALILLSHYVGDIHQPLHVGAAYFNDNNTMVTPAKGVHYRGDTGGNDISLALRIDGSDELMGNLHHYWDTNAVLNALHVQPNQFTPDLVQALISTEPASWKPPAGSKPVDWPKLWADDILPLAREAHTRLTFAPPNGDMKVIRATAPGAGTNAYDSWAAAQVKEAIHKAGWRLEYLVEQVMTGQP